MIVSGLTVRSSKDAQCTPPLDSIRG